LTRAEAVAAVLAGRARTPARAQGEGHAPVNIALVKYWGKRDAELNLPLTSSLSVALAGVGTRTRISAQDGADTVVLDGAKLPPQSPFAQRLSRYLDLVRPHPDAGYVVHTHNDVPTAAGLASSASGFAALVRALDHLHGWGLDPSALSILARLGSGSAARSLWDGFVLWHAGRRADGMDSHGEALPGRMPGLRVGLLTVSAAAKPIGSTAAMTRTRDTSPLYAAWPATVAADLARVLAAIAADDFAALGAAAEANALAMHGACLAASPPVLFLLAESLSAMRTVWRLREDGVPVFFTIDAGPNLKVLFQAHNETAVAAALPGLRIVAPFE
jgi:diphosphomevalonate decarboxylase